MRSTRAEAERDLGTRARLLEVAGEVFAEGGFRAATVRDICVRAGANVAAINYHFGDKERLYRAVLADALEASITRHPPDMGLGARPTPEERLLAFVRSFLLRVLGDAKPDWLMKLLAREMFEPTGALEHLVHDVHRPLFDRLRGIVRDVAGKNLEPADHVRCVHAVIAQCIFYKHAEPVLRAMKHPIPSRESDIDVLAHQITRFSIAGIRACARRERRGRR